MFVSMLLSPLLLGIRVLLPLLSFHLCLSSLSPFSPFSVSQASTSANMEVKSHEFSVHVCAMTPCIDLLLTCYSLENSDILNTPKIWLLWIQFCFPPLHCPNSLPCQCHSHLPHHFRTEVWRGMRESTVLTPKQIISAFLNADLEDIFLPSVNCIINHFFWRNVHISYLACYAHHFSNLGMMSWHFK